MTRKAKRPRMYAAPWPGSQSSRRKLHVLRMQHEKGIRQSMSRKGDCLVNAVIENFFGLLKSELPYLQKFKFMKHFKQELIAYLDYCDNCRSKVKRNGLPPAAHGQQALPAA